MVWTWAEEWTKDVEMEPGRRKREDHRDDSLIISRGCKWKGEMDADDPLWRHVKGAAKGRRIKRFSYTDMSKCLPWKGLFDFIVPQLLFHIPNKQTNKALHPWLASKLTAALACRLAFCLLRSDLIKAVKNERQREGKSALAHGSSTANTETNTSKTGSHYFTQVKQFIETK